MIGSRDKYPKGWKKPMGPIRFKWPTPPHKLPGGTNGGREIL